VQYCRQSRYAPLYTDRPYTNTISPETYWRAAAREPLGLSAQVSGEDEEMGTGDVPMVRCRQAGNARHSHTPAAAGANRAERAHGLHSHCPASFVRRSRSPRARLFSAVVADIPYGAQGHGCRRRRAALITHRARDQDRGCSAMPRRSFPSRARRNPPHLHRDCADPWHLCTGLGPPHACTGTGLSLRSRKATAAHSSLPFENRQRRLFKSSWLVAVLAFSDEPTSLQRHELH
jgi:hypothetical protein